MWQKVSSFILRNRVFLLVTVLVITGVMGILATRIEMTYQQAPLLPSKDSALIDYNKFVNTFGEEGNVIVIGIDDVDFFNLEHFNRWKKLCNDLHQIEGVENMLSVPNSFTLFKDTTNKQFKLQRIFPDTVSSQTELDSLALVFKSLPIYNGYLYNDSANAYIIVLTMNKDRMKTKEREYVVKSLKSVCTKFEEDNNVQLHYSGLPYFKVTHSIKIRNEIYLFSVLAMIICVFILFLIFRSFKAMLFPGLVVLIGAVTSLGVMVLFGFQITILTGMIPPLLIVIGIPNSIFMLNKYHNEYRLHGNQIKALSRVIQKIGNAIFLTNLTTACGFATFSITSSKMLKEFGIIASINIMYLFVLSILLIPIIFSFLPPPGARHVKHLDRKGIAFIVEKLVYLSKFKRRWAYVAMFVILGVSIYGITLMKTTGYMVDDISKNDPVAIDLRYFEKNFNGLMPLEIIVDTKKPNGILQPATLSRMEELDQRLKGYDELSASLSVLNVVKMAKQTFYNGDPEQYSLPGSSERNFIMAYAAKGNANINMARSFVDSTKQVGRMSIMMKDVGTNRMDELYNRFLADIAEIFPADKYNITVTGSSVIFFKGNQYLVFNLFQSIILAITLISLFMASMFRSARMVIVSLVPNMIPLLFTAGLMGYTGIPIKASTLLIFSIAFGISVDNTIHFLAKYRQELNLTNWNIQKAVRRALRETGFSMMYTSTVLFFGFGIFSLSKFGGTQAMGVLVSLTLFVALLSNLILLPSLLIGLERMVTTKSFKEPMLQIFDEEEDIDLDELQIIGSEDSDKKNEVAYEPNKRV